MKALPTCFGLQGNRHQGATTSTWQVDGTDRVFRNVGILNPDAG